MASSGRRKGSIFDLAERAIVFRDDRVMEFVSTSKIREFSFRSGICGCPAGTAHENDSSEPKCEHLQIQEQFCNGVPEVVKLDSDKKLQKVLETQKSGKILIIGWPSNTLVCLERGGELTLVGPA